MLLLQRVAQSELQSVHMPLATRTNVDLNSRDAHVRVGAAINDQKLVSAERLEARREDHHRLLALPPLAFRTGLPRRCLHRALPEGVVIEAFYSLSQSFDLAH